MTILYELGSNLYVNLTNRCPCRCSFCIRQKSKSVGTGDDLWLEHEPDFDEVIQAFGQKELSRYQTVVFCGYGEPLERIDLPQMLAVKLRVGEVVTFFQNHLLVVGNLGTF